MPSQLANYQCPNCGGPLRFDPELQKLKCDYCESVFTAAEVESFFSEKEEMAACAVGFEEGAGEWTPAEAANMRVYSCPACGAQLLAEQTSAVSQCPYCGNNHVAAHQFAGSKKPEYVIPFEINKQQAVDALNAFYKGKPFLPAPFRDQNHIEEVKGVYVPFWLYDGTMDTDIVYRGERIRQFQSGNDMVTETSHYQIVRKGTVEFQRVPADASSKMPDEYMDAIEPFDYSRLKPFTSVYMAGYMADIYDIDSDANRKRTDERMANSAAQVMRNTVHGYTNVVPVRQYIHRIRGTAVYAFLPVWLLSTNYEGQTYLFAVNGQTGKLIGDLPTDAGRFAVTFIVIALLISIVMAVALGVFA